MDVAARDGRIDGFRGLCGVAVVVSHFLGEVPSGYSVFEVGFIAVTIFFVMSGFLIGRLIMERGQCANFFPVFYARRLLRTGPSYLIIVGGTVLAAALPFAWAPQLGNIPVLSYFTFTQNIFMGAHANTGSEWIAPTWTLAVEEQFYLVAPLAIIFLPRPALLGAIVAASLAAIVVRLTGSLEGGHAVWHLVSLAGRADALGIGVAAAAISRMEIDWRKWDRALEVAPLAALVAAVLLTLILGRDIGGEVTTHLLIALGSAAFILRLAKNQTASTWLGCTFLTRTGHHSYSLYLVHMPVAVVVHGILLGTHPDIGSAAQYGAMAVSAVLTVLVAIVLTTSVEDPAMAFGRRFRWSSRQRLSTATT